MLEQSSQQRPTWSPLPPLSQADFDRFRELIRQRCGIRMADTKRLLLKNRIGRRLRALGIPSYRQYYDLVTSGASTEELERLLAAVTTNQTHFFREPHHFETLSKEVLPRLAVERQARKTIRIWSAGCSTGQEPYTLAAILSEFLISHPGWKVQVIASDIDPDVLEIARCGRYPLALKKEIPPRMMMRYFEVDGGELVVGEALRSMVRFKRQNLRLLEPPGQRFDVLFCRNVVMYFEHDFRIELARYYHRALADDGALFLGSSESLHGMPRIFVPLKHGRSLYYVKAPLDGGGV